MRFGHLMLCDQREGQSPQKRYEEMMEEVRLMDELGYWSVWFAEHHFDGYSLIPDSLLWCAAAARPAWLSCLSTTRCGPPNRQPWSIA